MTLQFAIFYGKPDMTRPQRYIFMHTHPITEASSSRHKEVVVLSWSLERLLHAFGIIQGYLAPKYRSRHMHSLPGG
jgi:hypothetical protein